MNPIIFWALVVAGALAIFAFMAKAAGWFEEEERWPYGTSHIDFCWKNCTMGHHGRGCQCSCRLEGF